MDYPFQIACVQPPPPQVSRFVQQEGKSARTIGEAAGGYVRRSFASLTNKTPSCAGRTECLHTLYVVSLWLRSRTQRDFYDVCHFSSDRFPSIRASFSRGLLCIHSIIFFGDCEHFKTKYSKSQRTMQKLRKRSNHGNALPRLLMQAASPRN